MTSKRFGRFLCLLGALALYGCADDPDNSIKEPEKSTAVCGNHTCENGESAASCPDDCAEKSSCSNGSCDSTPTPDKCGDGVCDILETFTSCPADCKTECGNSKCERSGGEDEDNCAKDCAQCGDGKCQAEVGEDKTSCSVDCGHAFECGDGTCNSGETILNCPADCGSVCGDGTCNSETENATNCEADCAESDIPYQSVCGDGTCDEDETSSCDADCKTVEVEQPLTMEAFNQLQESKFRFLYDYDLAMTPLSKKSADMTETEFAEQMSNFFSFPYPSDVRTDAYGHPLFANYPLPPIAILNNPLSEGLISVFLPKLNGLLESLVKRLERERKGFSGIGATYFRSSVLVDQKEFPKPPETTSPESCFQLIDVEPGSKYYGERVPIYVSYHRSANKVWPDNTLVMRPVPGLGAHPGHHYVSIVGNCLTSNGRAFNQSNKLRYILNELAPAEIQDKQAFYVEQIKALDEADKLGMKISDIRAMTGYYVMNPADEMDQMAEDLKGKGYIVADENGVAIGEWENSTTNGYSTEGFHSYIFKGKFVTANYINGQYPYTDPTGDPKLPVGEMTFDENGKLLSKRQEETIDYRIILPRTEMPEKGYPIIVYGHGTGGGSDTHCRYNRDEGITLINGGWIVNGRDPVTPKAVPVAMIGFDASLHESRANGADFGDFQMYMMMFNEPVVIRESWRQTVLDMLVLYDILDRGKLVLPPLPDSTDNRNVIFDPQYGMYMGHSQGAQEAGLLLGLTGLIKNAFLSAGGGGILLSFIDLYPDLSDLDDTVHAFIGDRSVADIVGMLMGLQDGDISYDTFITNHFIQPLVDPIDPLNYTSRFILDPPEGWPSKNIVQTIGIGDLSTPNAAQLAMVSAEGLPSVGEIYKVTDPMVLKGFDKSIGNSASNNIQVGDKTATGGAIQFNYKGYLNPHFVIYHMKSARDAYIDFFSSVLEGNPTVSVTGKQEDGDS